VNPSFRERAEFLQVLEECGLRTLASHPGRQEFEQGKADIRFSELFLDSLSLMEIGIAIEETYSVSVTPEEIARMGGLQELWDQVFLGTER